MEDFEAQIWIDVLEGELSVSLKTNRWGWSLSDDGFLTAKGDPFPVYAGETPEDDVRYAVRVAVEALLGDEAPI